MLSIWSRNLSASGTQLCFLNRQESLPVNLAAWMRLKLGRVENMSPRIVYKVLTAKLQMLPEKVASLQTH